MRTAPPNATAATAGLPGQPRAFPPGVSDAPTGSLGGMAMPPVLAEAVPPLPASPADSSGMGARMHSHEWSSSPLGAPENWPASLHTVVGLMLTSKFPMFVAWGPELAFLY